MNTSVNVAARPASEKVAISTVIKKNLREYGMLLSLAAIMIFFEIKTDGTLLQPLNLTKPGAAEQLHRDHGAGHVAGDCCRPH